MISSIGNNLNKSNCNNINQKLQNIKSHIEEMYITHSI